MASECKIIYLYENGKVCDPKKITKACAKLVEKITRDQASGVFTYKGSKLYTLSGTELLAFRPQVLPLHTGYVMVDKCDDLKKVDYQKAFMKMLLDMKKPKVVCDEETEMEESVEHIEEIASDKSSTFDSDSEPEFSCHESVVTKTRSTQKPSKICPSKSVEAKPQCPVKVESKPKCPPKVEKEPSKFSRKSTKCEEPKKCPSYKFEETVVCLSPCRKESEPKSMKCEEPERPKKCPPKEVQSVKSFPKTPKKCSSIKFETETDYESEVMVEEESEEEIIQLMKKCKPKQVESMKSIPKKCPSKPETVKCPPKPCKKPVKLVTPEPSEPESEECEEEESEEEYEEPEPIVERPRMVCPPKPCKKLPVASMQSVAKSTKSKSSAKSTAISTKTRVSTVAPSIRSESEYVESVKSKSMKKSSHVSEEEEEAPMEESAEFISCPSTTYQLTRNVSESEVCDPTPICSPSAVCTEESEMICSPTPICTESSELVCSPTPFCTPTPTCTEESEVSMKQPTTESEVTCSPTPVSSQKISETSYRSATPAESSSESECEPTPLPTPKLKKESCPKIKCPVKKCPIKPKCPPRLPKICPPPRDCRNPCDPCNEPCKGNFRSACEPQRFSTIDQQRSNASRRFQSNLTMALSNLTHSTRRKSSMVPSTKMQSFQKSSAAPSSKAFSNATDLSQKGSNRTGYSKAQSSVAPSSKTQSSAHQSSHANRTDYSKAQSNATAFSQSKAQSSAYQSSQARSAFNQSEYTESNLGDMYSSAKSPSRVTCMSKSIKKSRRSEKCGRDDYDESEKYSSVKPSMTTQQKSTDASKKSFREASKAQSSKAMTEHSNPSSFRPPALNPLDPHHCSSLTSDHNSKYGKSCSERLIETKMLRYSTVAPVESSSVFKVQPTRYRCMKMANEKSFRPSRFRQGAQESTSTTDGHEQSNKSQSSKAPTEASKSMASSRKDSNRVTHFTEDTKSSARQSNFPSNRESSRVTHFTESEAAKSMTTQQRSSVPSKKESSRVRDFNEDTKSSARQSTFAPSSIPSKAPTEDTKSSTRQSMAPSKKESSRATHYTEISQDLNVQEPKKVKKCKPRVAVVETKQISEPQSKVESVKVPPSIKPSIFESSDLSSCRPSVHDTKTSESSEQIVSFLKTKRSQSNGRKSIKSEKSKSIAMTEPEKDEESEEELPRVDSKIEPKIETNDCDFIIEGDCNVVKLKIKTDIISTQKVRSKKSKSSKV